MKTVNKGPQIFLDHKIIQSKAHQLNISFAFKPFGPPLPRSSRPNHLHTNSDMWTQTRGPSWTPAVLLNKNMASMYNTDSWVSAVDDRLRWKSTEEKNSAGSWTRAWASLDVGRWGRFTKKMRQTAHFSRWDTIIRKHDKFLLDLCVCENYRLALGP